MSRTLKRLQSLGAKAGAFALSGVLALSMTPAIALANDGQSGLRTASVLVASESDDGSVLGYVNSSDQTKAIIGESDPLNGGVELKSAADNTYQYKGFAHSDGGSHYQAYSLYTKLTTDANGTLTAIDVTSGNDTFAGKWGYQPAKVASGKGASTAIRGYLPTGFDFEVVKQGSAYSPKLSANDSVKDVESTLNSIALVKVTQSGSEYSASKEKAVYAVTSGRDGSTTVTKDDNFVTLDASGSPSIDLAKGSDYNLVRCTYIIGSEQTAFDMYFFAGDSASVAKEYAQSALSPTTWTEDPTSGYSANRDRWMHIVGSVMLRELGSWGAVIKDSTRATDTGLDGEIATLDTVSGATKTSSPFNQALEAAKAAGYVKGVSDDLVFTIDGDRASGSESLPRIDVTADSKDMSSVVTSNGNDVLSVVFPYKDTELTRADSHGVSLTKVSVYALKNQTVGTQGMMALAKQNSGSDEQPYEALEEYTAKDAVGGMWAFADATASESQDLRHKYVTAIDDANITFEYERYDDPLLITLKNKDVTHVVMQYSMGHGTIAIAYDIASMKAVANASAKSSLVYDVQPFFAQSTDAQELATSKLTSDEFTKTPGSIVLKDGKYVFTGEEIKPEIEKVLTKSGAELSSSEYTAFYSDNTNAGTATVTVTLKNSGATLTSSSQKTFTIERAQVAKPVAKANPVYSGKLLEAVAAGTGYTVSNGSAVDAGRGRRRLRPDARRRRCGRRWGFRRRRQRRRRKRVRCRRPVTRAVAPALSARSTRRVDGRVSECSPHSRSCSVTSRRSFPCLCPFRG